MQTMNDFIPNRYYNNVDDDDNDSYRNDVYDDGNDSFYLTIDDDVDKSGSETSDKAERYLDDEVGHVYTAQHFPP